MTREPGEIELIFQARNFGKARQGPVGRGHAATVGTLLPRGGLMSSRDAAAVSVDTDTFFKAPLAEADPEIAEAIGLELGRDAGHPVDLLYVAADISTEETAHLESLLWERMDFDHHLERDDIGTFVEGNRRRHSDSLAIAQLFITYHLLNAAAGGNR